MSTCRSYRPVAPFIFLAKIPIWPFFLKIEGVLAHIDVYDVSLVTLILNIYGFVGSAP